VSDALVDAVIAQRDRAAVESRLSAWRELNRSARTVSAVVHDSVSSSNALLVFGTNAWR